ncbi:hypothetical protein PG299_02670 [Riemerella anatipestifer]|nr:hypothetical protein [Riemerella anatipestifer]MDY3443433.1 hypothetical protein [Riemerella anatipestifer]
MEATNINSEMLKPVLPENIGTDLENLSEIIYDISNNIDPYGNNDEIQKAISKIITLSSILNEKSKIVSQVSL